ncbi:MAG: hypothetical protein JXA82_18130 [Sedimentisphaerales bacterium]|nr:hypothetical protein [Sedimentisphaerales bacterium]
MKLSLASGSTSKSVCLFISQSDGNGLTGLAYNTSGLTCYYVRLGSAAVSVTLATQTVTGAYGSGGFVEIDSTNMPGVYRFDIPNAALVSGAETVIIMLRGAANMVPVVMEIQLNMPVLLANVSHTIVSLTVNNPSGNAVTLYGGGSNGHGFYTQGSGGGEGLRAQGGSTDGHGAMFLAGGNGNGLYCYGLSGSGHGAHFQGGVAGTGAGLRLSASVDGVGLHVTGGSTGGHGAQVEGGSSGNTYGIYVKGHGTRDGITSTGGDEGGHGIIGHGGLNGGAGILGEGGLNDGPGVRGMGHGSASGYHGSGGLTGNGFLGTGGTQGGNGASYSALGGDGKGLNLAGAGTGEALSFALEESRTFQQALRVLCAVFGGKSEVDTQAGTITFFGANDTKIRLVVSISSGQRISVDTWDGD